MRDMGVTGAEDAANPPAGAASILGAAVQLFGQQGYDNVSMRELAALAGCSPANLYHHYRSKYDIFVQLMRRAMDLHLTGLHAALADHDDPVEQLRHVLANHLRLHMERPEVRLLRSDLHPLHGEERQRFIARRDEYERGVRAIVVRAGERGLVEVEDPKLAVMAALGACTQVDGWYRPDGELPAEEVARRITDFLLAGFGVRSERRAAL
jgi:AcrR family transcriptional regulator